MGAGANWYSTWCVTLVQFVIRVDVYLVDWCLSLKLDVHQMRQLSIGLPICVHAIITQLLHTETYSILINKRPQLAHNPTKKMPTLKSFHVKLPGLHDDKLQTAWAPTSVTFPVYSSFIGSLSPPDLVLILPSM